MKNYIDVRSDTVTRPDQMMLAAMTQASVGDDVYADDPTVNEFQEFAADLLAHEAALFMPTGTQSNLCALLTHCQRGDEYIVGGDAHTYKYEGGGAAVLGGIQPQPLAFGDDGMLNLDDVVGLIKADDFHFARTKLLCLENTQHGRVQSLAYMREAQRVAKQHGLQIHLDGARMANAAVKLGVSLADIAGCFDTVSLCLSKGLGAPVGSLLLGSRPFIEEARRWRKVTGGGMRQAGVLAAAGMVALRDGVERMVEDHEHALMLADGLDGIAGLKVRREWLQTNMVWVDYEKNQGEHLVGAAKDAGILLAASYSEGRMVMHRDVATEDVKTLIEFMRSYFA